jgi:geranyl-CoA carboxylase beta subunit
MALSAEKLISSMEQSSESMFCSSRMMDDGIIDPVDTRQVLIFTLETCLESTLRGTRPNSFGVARF